jgi:hypothetical protein
MNENTSFEPTSNDIMGANMMACLPIEEQGPLSKKEMHAINFPQTVEVLKRVNLRHKRCIEEAMLKTEEGRAELIRLRIQQAKEFDARRTGSRPQSSEKARIAALKTQRAEEQRMMAAKKKAEQAAQGRSNK